MVEVKPFQPRMARIRAFVNRRPWSIISWTAGLAALAFITYYGLQATTNSQVGIQFVSSEWPDPSIFPVYAKPITWFAYFSFVYWAAGLESNRNHFLQLSSRVRNILFLFTALVAFASFYEIFYNFMVWLALIGSTCQQITACNPDTIASIFDLKSPLNLVFATKIVTTTFGLSMYSLWFLYRVDMETQRQNDPLKVLDEMRKSMPRPLRKPLEVGAGLAAQQSSERTGDPNKLVSQEQ